MSSPYSQSLVGQLDVSWWGQIVDAEDASGTLYGWEDWQCGINGVHTAALLSIDTVPAFGNMDKDEAFEGNDIEDWTLYVIRLDDLGNPDVFLTRT